MESTDFVQRLEQVASEVGLAESDWPTLDPLPTLDHLDSHVDSFPIDALGPIAGQAAKAVANKVQAPDAIAAGSVLGCVAVATQPLADVVLPHGAVAPLSLAIITAAASGDRKSATDALAAQPLEDFRRAQYRVFAKEFAQWELTKGMKGERPAPPVAKSLTVSKATVEGLTKQLRHQSHVGLFSPDGADVLGGHSMQAERRASGIAWHLRAWSAESLDNLTAGEGLSAVTGRRVSMHLLVQPVVLHELMADPLAQGQGLIARCLISAPRTLAGTRLFKLPTAEDEARIAFFHDRINQLLSLKPDTHPEGDGFELAPRRLHLDEHATALWIAFHNELEVRMAPDADLAGVRPWVSKAPEQAARIAAGLTVLADPHASVISAEYMVCGLQVAAYFLGEHVRLMGLSRKVDHIKQLLTLWEFMSSRGRPISQEHLLQYAPRSLRLRKAEGLAPLLQELTQRGYIRHRQAAWEVRPCP
jgi:putative DNA primase/helicase